MKTFTSTPRQDGFYMPGEFGPHSACWMAWPQRHDTWREEAIPAQKAFAAVAAALVETEPVKMAVPAEAMKTARAQLDPRVQLFPIASDDAWMRDIGPTCVINAFGEQRGIDWQFNAWGGFNGGLHAPWDQDNAVACEVLKVEGMACYRAPLVLEGGAIHVDGQGTLITTEECLLNPNRNPQLTRQEIEQLLRDYLAVETIIWLTHGCYNDETDGHVDNLCCFVRPGEVLLNWTEDRSDPQHDRSQAAYEILRSAVDARGRRLKVHKIAQPAPMLITAAEASGVAPTGASIARHPGDRLVGSYVNFYSANRRILFPLLDPHQDDQARQQLQRLFPAREVVGIPAREILLGGGNLHCITQQIPCLKAVPQPQPG